MRSKLATFGFGGTSEVTCGGNALKFYASIRLNIRRIGLVKKGEEVLLFYCLFESHLANLSILYFHVVLCVIDTWKPSSGKSYKEQACSTLPNCSI